MKNTQKTQVVIVGAGPTGLNMAVQLLRYGIDFVIIDKKEKASEFSKAIAVQARTLEIFEEINLAQKAIDAGKIIISLNVFEEGNKKVTLPLQELGKGISKYDFALSLAQNETERLLLEYLNSHNKYVIWNADYSHFTETSEGVTVYYHDNNSLKKSVKAAYIVGADGASSKLREEMGLGFGGETDPKLFYVADVNLKSAIINENKIYAFLIKKGFILLLPMKDDDNYRVVGIVPDSDKSKLEDSFDKMIPYVKEQIKVGVEFSDVKWFSKYKVHTRKAATFSKGRSFLAGDSAHIHTPAGGQGMNTGIQDAYNLAWKMAFTLQGKVNQKVLDSYSDEREENAIHLLKTTDRIFDIIAGINWFWNFLRLKIFPIVANYIANHKSLNKFLFPLISQTAIQYSPNLLTVKSKIEKAEAGVRMPYFVFKDGKDIFQYLKDPSFKLLFFGETGKDRFKDLNISTFPISKMAFTEIPTSIFQKNRNFYVFLRPDSHVIYVGKDLNICNEAVSKIQA